MECDSWIKRKALLENVTPFTSDTASKSWPWRGQGGWALKTIVTLMIGSKKGAVNRCSFVADIKDLWLLLRSIVSVIFLVF